MPFSGLKDFISFLEKNEEIIRINTFVDPELEMTEITDRLVKNGGKALLFENNGTSFPVLMNAYASDYRMAAALGKNDIEELKDEIGKLLTRLDGHTGSLMGKIKSLPGLIKISGYFPSKIRGRGLCQRVICKDPDLAQLPVLKCWPHDGGRFITLPMVHTRHPVTGAVNVGMYRMQILDNKTTAMHWQRHKTGANHFEAWKKIGKIMPVSVTLGGDPAYTWSATAPLPENLDEYILAGFIRKKKVKLVRCITNDLWVPDDADIVIEGFVDPAGEMVWEGPFGDHTGFYSLADWYPRFHVTCITHSQKAVYPATIVGIPPHEDSWFARATEKIFLNPVRIAVQPEIEDFHMPDPGVAHNLLIVKIKKSYPGQGKKVISALLGAGQMMFTKYLIIVSSDVDIRNYNDLARDVFENTLFLTDLMFTSGPLDVLDHSSDIFSVGGKMGIDATQKLEEEMLGRVNSSMRKIRDKSTGIKNPFKDDNEITGIIRLHGSLPVMIIRINQTDDPEAVARIIESLNKSLPEENVRLIIGIDHRVDPGDLFTVAWQVLGNSDPARDIILISDNTLFIDGTPKVLRKGGFRRRWPNIVTSSKETITKTDQNWPAYGIGTFIPSPSLKFLEMNLPGDDEVILKS